MIDAAGTGIEIVGANVQASESSLLFVVQRSTNQVGVPAAASVEMPPPIASGVVPVTP